VVSAGLERGIQQCRKIKSLRCGASRHSSWRLSIFEGSERNENKRDGKIARDRRGRGRGRRGCEAPNGRHSSPRDSPSRTKVGKPMHCVKLKQIAVYIGIIARAANNAARDENGFKMVQYFFFSPLPLPRPRFDSSHSRALELRNNAYSIAITSTERSRTRRGADRDSP